MFKKLGLALGSYIKKPVLIVTAFIACAALPVAAQMWWPFPQIGGSSYCSSSVNNVCVTTIPAGPALTGNETFPTDTNATGGQNPQTGKTSILTLGAGPYQYVAPLAAATINIANTTRQLVIDPAGTIGSLYVAFPPSNLLLDGQKLGICTTQIITALVIYSGAATVNGAPTAGLVPVTTGGASCPEWLYRTANTTWYRIH